MMLGRFMMPRWRLPLWLLLAALLSGCAAQTGQGNNGSGLPVPSVRMSLLKIPLNRAGKNPMGNQEPIERFTPEAVAVAQKPRW